MRSNGLGFETAEEGRLVSGFRHHKALCFKGLAQYGTDRGFILDDENADLVSSALLRATDVDLRPPILETCRSCELLRSGELGIGASNTRREQVPGAKLPE